MMKLRGNVLKLLALMLVVALSVLLAACTPAEEEADDPEGSGETEETVYYLAGNFCGYEPAVEEFKLSPIEDEEGWYEITVELTEENRDTTYDGHYYKITNGTWDDDGTWGADFYALQPAPESPTGGGLGSVWVYENMTLTVHFDSVNKVIYDNSMVREFETPRIYGDFNAAMDRGADWSVSDGEALELEDRGDGTFSAEYEIPAYSGENEDGYSMAVALSEIYYIDEYGRRWGVNEQYKFDGTPAGMAGVSNLKPDQDTTYVFTFDSDTKVTTVSAK